MKTNPKCLYVTSMEQFDEKFYMYIYVYILQRK